MKKGIKLLSAALLVSAAGFIAACGTGGESSSLENEELLGTASLSVAVKFPKRDIAPQYIDNDIRCIEVNYHKGIVNKHLVLTSDNPRGVIDNIVPGKAIIKVRATDHYEQDNNTGETYCVGNDMDFVKVFADIKEGENNLITTLIAPAQWKIVDENDQPKNIVFNKIKTDSTESISAFNITKPEGPHIMSIDFTRPSGISFYKVEFIGNDMNTDNDAEYGCVSPNSCITEGKYLNQFMGPDTSENAFGTEPVALAPVHVGNDMFHREFWIMGMKPMYDEEFLENGVIKSFKALQADNTDIIEDFENRFGYTKVVDANHMQGTIIEILEKGKNKEIICSTDKEGNNVIDCPQGLMNYLSSMDNDEHTRNFDNDMNGGNEVVEDNDNFRGNNPPAPASIKTVAIDNDNCYRDVNVIEQETVDYLHIPFANCESTRCDYNMDGKINDNDDINRDGDVNDNDNYYIIKRTTTLTDVCVYPFRAKAEKIEYPTLNLYIQNK